MAITIGKKKAAPVVAKKVVKAAPAAAPAKKAVKPAAKVAASSTKKVVKAKASNKPAKQTFHAPEDVRSAFIEVGFITAIDGLIAPGVTVEYIKGKPDNENAPRYDLMVHDSATASALIARLSGRLFAPNISKRLTPETEYVVQVRLSVSKSKDNQISASVRNVWISNAKGKLVLVDLKDPKNDPSVTKELRRDADGKVQKDEEGNKLYKVTKVYSEAVKEVRKIRSSGRFLAPAFTDALGPVELKALDKAYQAYPVQAEAGEEEADDE